MTLETPILDESAVSEIEAHLHLTTDGDAVFVLNNVRALCDTVKHLRVTEKTLQGQVNRLAELAETRSDLIAAKAAHVDQLQSQLEQLRAERDELRNALLPFALLDIRHLQDRSDHEPIWAINKSQITIGLPIRGSRSRDHREDVWPIRQVALTRRTKAN